jgi:predicted PurR-regulated permease PerM
VGWNESAGRPLTPRTPWQDAPVTTDAVPPPPPESPGPIRTPEERQVITMIRWGLIALFVVIGWTILSYAAHVLGPILVAFGIAYLLDPVLERMVKRGVPRSLGALGLLVIFLGTVVTLLIIFIPRIAAEIGHLIVALPGMIENLSRWVESYFGFELPDDWVAYFQSHDVQSYVGDAAGPFGRIASAAVGGALGVFGFFAEMLLVPVFAFYFLADWPNITKRIVRIVPPRRRSKVLDVLYEIDRVVSGWVRGQMTVTVILAILYAIAFSIVGIPGAIPIGLVVGVLTIIPFVGTLVGAAIALGITIGGGSGMNDVVGVLITIGLLHGLEAFILTPKIVGHRVGLSEVAALFAVVAGGKLLGFVGILLAVPIAAAVAVLIRHAVRYYESSQFFGTEADAVVPVTAAMSVVMPDAAIPLEPEPDKAAPRSDDDKKENP